MAKAKIVVVDGEPIVRTVVTNILVQAGYSVEATADYKHALERCKDNPPNLVLTNVMLPGITGHDAMRLFRANCPGVPVLMVAGLPSEPTIDHWINEDGFDLFPKPFTAGMLVSKIEE